jgi:hypothetical protein
LKDYLLNKINKKNIVENQKKSITEKSSFLKV